MTKEISKHFNEEFFERLKVGPRVGIWSEYRKELILETRDKGAKEFIVVRLCALWNASRGMTTERAIYLLLNSKERLS